MRLVDASLQTSTLDDFIASSLDHFAPKIRADHAGAVAPARMIIPAAPCKQCPEANLSRLIS
ncbi:hypothetical protein XH80_21490 [Bradyrhizobium sp. CCBAU 45384]|nr:hypothetical protein [Bradyrhizobium sp. CCBAU 45384]